jgi:hypothetical protein
VGVFDNSNISGNKMSTEVGKYKFLLLSTSIALLLALFYPQISNLLNFNALNNNDASSDGGAGVNEPNAACTSNKHSLIKKDIIQSWNDIIVYPNRHLKVAIG